MNTSFNATTDLLNKELMMDEYSYRVDGMTTTDAQYDFNHVSAQPPASSYMKRTAQGQTRMSAVPGTRGGRNVDTARPMTSNRAAGYTAAGKPAPGTFDPMNQGAAGGQPVLQKKPELSPEEKLRAMEKDIHRLIEESARLAKEEGKPRDALEKAKEAGKKERQLCRLREQNNLLDALNVDLTYTVCLNLAIQHDANDNDNEALAIYTQIVKNKQYPASGRFRVNMGNIYFKQGKWTSAIKMYRMALDQVSNDMIAMRLKITRNIGHAFFKMHQFTDAVESYENLLANAEQFLDFVTGFNIILCYYALGNQEKMKASFLKLLNIEQPGLEDFEEEEDEDEDDPGGLSSTQAKENKLIKGDDALREDVKRRQREAAKLIMNAANLIGPVIDKAVVPGYDWIIEALNQNGFPRIGSEIEIAKACHHLKNKEFDVAIQLLKRFEKKEPSLMACAATNLSFIYFLEADYAQADKYADLAVKSDRYNARALVNKANCLFMQDEPEHAKEIYLEAIGVSADCLEAIYNLGLVNVQVGKHQEALLAFDKLQSITKDSWEVMWQLGDCHERLGNIGKAHEWFSLLVTAPKGRPTDPGVLARLANLQNQAGDETQAFHYHLESYRYWPVDMNVITWLGIYYVKQEMYEAAIPYFQSAAQIEPAEVKWKLMVASCYRRMGALPAALKLYEDIHRANPTDVECLRYLITICKDMNQKYDHYAASLSRLERLQQQDMQNAPNPNTRHAIDEEDEEEIPSRPIKGPAMGSTFAGAFGGRNARGDDGDPPPAPPVKLFEADEGLLPPKAPKKRMMATVKASDDDDWGDDDLGDVLPPDF